LSRARKHRVGRKIILSVDRPPVRSRFASRRLAKSNGRLAGTDTADRVQGSGGNDVIRGLAGRDRLYGGYVRVHGGKGPDQHHRRQRKLRRLRAGFDPVNDMPAGNKGPRDVYENCEQVLR